MEGKVSFKNSLLQNGEVILTGGESSAIHENEMPEVAHKVDVNRYLAWMKNESISKTFL